MSRVAKSPVTLPAGVEVKQEDSVLSVKKGSQELQVKLYPTVSVEQEDGELRVRTDSTDTKDVAMAGTMRALINNAVIGVTQGFEKKLQLLGVGYRVKASGQTLDLTLGFSHPVVYEVPESVTVETPSQTEIVLKSADKQLLGQVASEVRAFRPPEPYKGKGVRYADERVRLKEAKKK